MPDDKEIERFAAALRPEADADCASADPVVREAGILRTLLRRHREAGGDLSMTEHQWQRLLFRLRREKLLGPARPVALYALAASVGIAAVGLALLRPLWLSNNDMPTEAGQVRGGDESIRLTASDPSAMADRIEAVLKRHAIEPRRVEAKDAVQLQARVPVKATAARQDLLALGVTVAAHGRLDLWIVRGR
ncbi:MAG: hypothetical protein Q8M11_22310 [Sulfuritalea sp.]|nr:hypothetical protein [Sulfuritalea sp.]